MEELIFNYFPNLSLRQKEQFSALNKIYSEWNEKINVISRKDSEFLYIHHVLHSLSIARFINFPKGSAVMDMGTGGGFPGIPLAILYPEVSFFLCDSVRKKIEVVNNVVSSINIKNVVAQQSRAEDLSIKFDFIVSRAVAELPELVTWCYPLLNPGNINGKERGLISLKGGNLNAEIAKTAKKFSIPLEKITQMPITKWFDNTYFEQKYLIFIPAESINICR